MGRGREGEKEEGRGEGREGEKERQGGGGERIEGGRGRGGDTCVCDQLIFLNHRSVLENHHVSLAFRVTEDTENQAANIFQSLDG